MLFDTFAFIAISGHYSFGTRVQYTLVFISSYIIHFDLASLVTATYWLFVWDGFFCCLSLVRSLALHSIQLRIILWAWSEKSNECFFCLYLYLINDRRGITIFTVRVSICFKWSCFMICTRSTKNRVSCIKKIIGGWCFQLEKRLVRLFVRSFFILIKRADHLDMFIVHRNTMKWSAYLHPWQLIFVAGYEE